MDSSGNIKVKGLEEEENKEEKKAEPAEGTTPTEKEPTTASAEPPGMSSKLKS